MNASQWTILFLAVALFALSEVFPPWLHYCAPTFDGVTRSAGYSFVTKAPRPINSPCSSDPIPPLTAVRKNFHRLNVQRAIIIVFASGLLLLMKRRTKGSLAIAGVVMCVGFLGVLYFLFLIWADS